MENDFSIKLAMETAVSQAESFDQSDFAAGDSVPVYRPNAQTGRDELVGKIPKSYFMQAALASMKDLLRGANLGTNIDKVPTLNANNFGSTSIADLASVLGGIMLNASETNFNSLTAFGTYAVTNVEYWDNKPSGANGSGFVICGGWNYGGNTRTLQVLYLQDNTAYFRAYNPSGSLWQSWQRFSFDIPTFYKNYSTLAALGVALQQVSYETSFGTKTSIYTLDQNVVYSINSQAEVNKMTDWPADLEKQNEYIIFKSASIHIIISSEGSMYLKRQYQGYEGSWGKIIFSAIS